jgi:hypothetical protein
MACDCKVFWESLELVGCNIELAIAVIVEDGGRILEDADIDELRGAILGFVGVGDEVLLPRGS